MGGIDMVGGEGVQVGLVIRLGLGRAGRARVEGS